MAAGFDLERLKQDFFSARSEGFDLEAQTIFKKEEEGRGELKISPPVALDKKGVFVEVAELVGSEGFTLVPDRLIVEVFRANFGEGITNAELKLLKRLLCAKSLREISNTDGASYETRRNQLKRLLEKSGFSRQTEFLLTMSSLVVKAQLVETGTNREFCEPLQSYLDKHYRSQFRVYSFETRSGTKLLIGDYGPIDGKPCIMLHSSAFTVFPLPHQTSILSEIGVRLITPYRPGYFDVPIAPQRGRKSIEAYMEALVEFLGIFGLAKAPLISFAYGSTVALSLLSKMPVPMRAVVCAPTNMTSKTRKNLSPHVGAMFKLCEQYPRLAEALTRTLYASTASTAQIAMVLKQYFGPSMSDMKEIQGGLTQRSLLSLLMDGGSSCIPGLVNDFGLVVRPLQAVEPECLENTTIVFGHEDYITRPEDIRIVSGFEDASIEVVEGFGRGTFMFQPEVLLSMVAPR